EDGIRAFHVTGVQTCALPIYDLLIHNMGSRLSTRASTDPMLWIRRSLLRRSKVASAASDVLPKSMTDPPPALPLSEIRVLLMVRSEERRVGKERGARGLRQLR